MGGFRLWDEGPRTMRPARICDHWMDPRDWGARGMVVLGESWSPREGGSQGLELPGWGSLEMEILG